MKFSAFILTLIVIITSGFVHAENPLLVEMPMTEDWSNLPDIQDITVIWHSDKSAVLTVTQKGIDLMLDKSVRFQTLTEMLPDRDYYTVAFRNKQLPENMTGVMLQNNHFLVSLQADSLPEYSRDISWNRLWPSKQTISSLEPPVYISYAPREHNPVIQAFADKVQESYIYELLVDMVAFETRYSFAPQCVDAVNWAADEFESWGYDVELVPHTSGMAPNLIAWKHGAVNPDRIWVVGGHLDSISTPEYNYTLAPGANDNGTGSALTMHSARLLKNVTFEDTVVFALWTGEEQGLYGSTHWANWANSQGLNILGKYNFDMIGWLDEYPQDLDIIVNTASHGFGLDFGNVADMYTSLLYDVYVDNGMAYSDHWPFWQNGYVAFCGIEDYWPPYPYYHTIDDTVDKIYIPFTTEVTRAFVANICVAAQVREAFLTQQDMVNCDTDLDIMLIDRNAIGFVTVEVSSNTEPEPEIITLHEASANTFVGTIEVTDAPPVNGNGKISVTHGDVISVTYPEFGQTVLVEVDCMPPLISDISVTGITADSFIVGWQTDKPSDSVIKWGTVLPPNNTVANSTMTTSHSIQVSGLNDNTQYFFMIESNDLAGNTAQDDNNGSYYTVTTLQTLWDQPVSASNPSRRANQVFPGSQYSGYTSYLADDFVNTETWLIEEIFVPGELYNGGSSLANAQTLHWRIYSDDNGLPAGYPGGGAAPFWSLDLEPGSNQVFLLNGLQNNPSDTSLALETPIQLPAGTWWLMFYPTMTFSPNGQFGRISSDTTNGVVGKFINPGGSFGYGTNWMDWNNVSSVTHHDIAFRLSGSIPGQATPTPAPPTPTPTPGPGDCLHTGDVNFDGAITAADAQLAFQIALGLYTPTYEEECAADCNGDGIVTASDAQQIFLTALGLDTCADPL